VYGLADGTAVVQVRYSYDAYGTRSSSTENVPTNWGFTGRRHDRTDGMYYRQRYYEPGAGVFTGVDPLLRRQWRGHPYRYAEADPTRWTDPTGEMTLAQYDHPYNLDYKAVPEDHFQTVFAAARWVGMTIQLRICKRAFEVGCGKRYFPGLEKQIYDNAIIYYYPGGKGRYGESIPGTSPYHIAYTPATVRNPIGLYGFIPLIIHEMGHHAGIDHNSIPIDSFDLEWACSVFSL